MRPLLSHILVSPHYRQLGCIKAPSVPLPRFFAAVDSSAVPLKTPNKGEDKTKWRGLEKTIDTTLFLSKRSAISAVRLDSHYDLLFV